MIAVGIDIGKKRHAAAVLDGNGAPLLKPAFYANNAEGARKLVADIAGIAPPDSAVVGMEATGSYWAAFRDFLAAAGYHVAVINPILTSASICGDVRGRKTDKGDAVAIARTVLGGYHAACRDAGTDFRRLKALTRQRSFLVGQRSDLKRRLESLLDEAFPEFYTLFDDLFAALPTALLRRYPTAAALARARLTSVAKVVEGNSRGRDAEKEAERLVAAAKASLGSGSAVADADAKCVLSTLKAISGLDELIGEMDDEIAACEPPDLAAILMKISGAGKLLPKVIAAEFGDLARFRTDPKTGSSAGMYKRMLAYAGAEPRIRESGKWKGKIRMSKRGSGALRTALMLIANTIRQNDPFFGELYDRRKKEGKPHKVAISYVVEKLLKVVCSLYTNNRDYTVQTPTVCHEGLQA